MSIILIMGIVQLYNFPNKGCRIAGLNVVRINVNITRSAAGCQAIIYAIFCLGIEFNLTPVVIDIQQLS